MEKFMKASDTWSRNEYSHAYSNMSKLIFFSIYLFFSYATATENCDSTSKKILTNGNSSERRTGILMVEQ